MFFVKDKENTEKTTKDRRRFTLTDRIYTQSQTYVPRNTKLKNGTQKYAPFWKVVAMQM